MAPVRLFLSGLALLFIGLFTPSAQAQSSQGWSLCNKTSFVIEAAIGRPEGSGVVVEGWTKLRPGACEVAGMRTMQQARLFLAPTFQVFRGV